MDGPPDEDCQLEDGGTLDPAASHGAERSTALAITVELSVCFSATYRVPVLCFAGYEACACCCD